MGDDGHYRDRVALREQRDAAEAEQEKLAKACDWLEDELAAKNVRIAELEAELEAIRNGVGAQSGGPEIDSDPNNPNVRTK